MNANTKAFLDVIATSEGTKGKGDDGYNVVVGGALFHPYDDHPRVSVALPNLGIHSTAAGRYQITAHNFDYYSDALDLPDFGHDSQDKIALQLIKECNAQGDIDAGNFDTAAIKCNSRWASFPGAGYGQHENKMSALRDAFAEAGGVVA